jgi:2Fe-2S ferredoxin
MPLIQFRKNRAPIDVPSDTNLMEALVANGLPVASSCGGDGVCAKCRVEVVTGRENLSMEGDREKSLRERQEIPSNERLSCQVRVLGDVTIDTSYW